MAEKFPGAAAALARSGAKVVDEWLSRFEGSRLRVPGPVDRKVLNSPARGIAGALGLALVEPGCAPGTQALRETEKLVAFAGGSFGMASASAFDVVAFVLALRDTLFGHAGSIAERTALAELFDWLGALAVEGYGSSRLEALELRHRDSLERGTPVVMITPELPAALLVGEPPKSVLESVFGRLLLAIVRVDPRAVIIDGGGLVSPGAPSVLEALAVFANHRKLKGLTTMLSGLPPAVEPEWSSTFPAPARVVLCERFDEAVTRALELSRRP